MVSVPSLHPGLMAACHPWNPHEIKDKLFRMQGGWNPPRPLPLGRVWVRPGR